MRRSLTAVETTCEWPFVSVSLHIQKMFVQHGLCLHANTNVCSDQAFVFLCVTASIFVFLFDNAVKNRISTANFLPLF